MFHRVLSESEPVTLKAQSKNICERVQKLV